MVFETNSPIGSKKIYCGYKNETRHCESNDTLIDLETLKKFVFDKDQNDQINFKYTRSMSYLNEINNELYISKSYSSAKSISISKHNFNTKRVVALDTSAIIGSKYFNLTWLLLILIKHTLSQ